MCENGRKNFNKHIFRVSVLVRWKTISRLYRSSKTHFVCSLAAQSTHARERERKRDRDIYREKRFALKIQKKKRLLGNYDDDDDA